MEVKFLELGSVRARMDEARAAARAKERAGRVKVISEGFVLVSIVAYSEQDASSLSLWPSAAAARAGIVGESKMRGRESRLC